MPLSQYGISSINRLKGCTHLKFKLSPLWSSSSNEIKEYGIEVAFDVITAIQHFIKIHESFQKLHHLISSNVRHFGVICITFNVITYVHNFIQIHQLVQKLHPPQTFKRPPFWNG
jgi:hypothetical protein